MLDSLPIIDSKPIASCDGCGACCMEQSSPPGYVLVLCQPEAIEADGPFAEDAERIVRMPQKIKATLLRYIDRLRKSPSRDETPCIWLDMTTRKCLHYEWRPSICREELQIGDDGCRRWRFAYGIR